jgi:hypothetical protein
MVGKPEGIEGMLLPGAKLPDLEAVHTPTFSVERYTDILFDDVHFLVFIRSARCLGSWVCSRLQLLGS